MLGLMLYLIFTRAITVGQFFSCWIYSFFIFGLLQEVGNVMNIYRETEVSLNNFEAGCVLFRNDSGFRKLQAWSG